MMETKLWAALCALLLIHLGSAEHDNGHTTASNAPISGGGEAAPEAPSVTSVVTSSLDSISHTVTVPDTSARVTSSLSSDTTTEGKTTSLTPETKKDNGTDIVSPSEAAGPEKNQTDQVASQPPVPPSESHAPTSHVPLASATISPPPTAHSVPADTTTASTNTSTHAAFVPSEPTRPETHSVTSVPTSEKPNLETITTTTISNSSSTSSTSSSKETPSTATATPTTLTSSQNTLHPETSSAAHQKSPIDHSNPSQLNVGGDTTMIHDPPTLDPLLAGLVSAFIITAVIITLLLFLKLRRRDNRPEFRRLQDLPMDDMMEDTPLSMYSY